jgi:diguanylate cyclase (GGDEF)-like protein
MFFRRLCKGRLIYTFSKVSYANGNSESQMGAIHLRKKPIQRFVFLLTAAFLLMLPVSVAAAPAEKPEEEKAPKRVTFLSSYSLAYPTVQQQIDGINEEMQGQDVILSYEFMDTKTFDTDQDMAHFSDYLSYKWNKGGMPDLVIAGDDSALQLALDKRNGLFADIPVVFEAIDDTARAERAHLEGMTGVLESGPLRDNIDLARKVYPKATHVMAIVDNTPSGRGAILSFLALQKEYPDLKLELLNTSRMTADEIRKKLQKLDSDTILLYYIFSVDGSGKKYTTSESAKLLFDNAAVPIFYYSLGVGTGALGGIQVDYKEMGRMAAETGLKVLDGANCGEIPLAYNTPTTVCFDAAVMRTYHIPKSVLPKDATYLNEDNTAKLRAFVVVVCCGSAVLLILLALVTWDNYRRNRREAQLLKNESALRRQAEHDALTSLCNRRRFCNHLEDRLAQKQPTALLAFDIDRFKQINDTYGHQAGDAVLIEVGRRMKALLDENISIYRYGGDEFAALVKSGNVEMVLLYAEKLSSAVKKPFILDDGQDIHVTISLGFARYPQDGKDSASLIACADAALYSVKRNGRGSIQNYAEMS